TNYGQCNVKPKPCSRRFTDLLVADLLKFPKEPSLIWNADTNSGVSYLDYDILISLKHFQCDDAFLGEFQCVAYQVVQNLAHPRCVGLDRSHEVGQRMLKFKVMTDREGPELVNRFVHRFPQIN